MARIGKRVVDAAQPAEDGRYIVWDDSLKGFGLLVLPSGVKSFIFDYRTREGRKRRITIAKVGTIAPEKARETADKYSDIVKSGGDPLEEKAEARQALTVDDVLDRYLESRRFRVLALTGARRGEITGLRWSQVDLKTGTITLPPAAHKAGRKTGKPRIIVLPAAAAEIIARQPSGEADGYVFAPAKGQGPLNLNKPWRDIRTRAKLPEGIGLHGLRHTMASLLAMGGAQAPELQAALGHSTIAMAVKYVHWADNARKSLAERAAAPALAGLAAANGHSAGEVAPLPKKSVPS